MGRIEVCCIQIGQNNSSIAAGHVKNVICQEMQQQMGVQCPCVISETDCALPQAIATSCQPFITSSAKGIFRTPARQPGTVYLHLSQRQQTLRHLNLVLRLICVRWLMASDSCNAPRVTGWWHPACYLLGVSGAIEMRATYLLTSVNCSIQIR